MKSFYVYYMHLSVTTTCRQPLHNLPLTIDDEPMNREPIQLNTRLRY